MKEKIKQQLFSNGTEFMYFQENNCLNCSKYENESKSIKDAGCSLAYEIDFASINDGRITVEAYNRVGFDTVRQNAAVSCKEKTQ